MMMVLRDNFDLVANIYFFDFAAFDPEKGLLEHENEVPKAKSWRA
jgi:hypothetical protein